MRVNRPFWPVIAMILAGYAAGSNGVVIMGSILAVLWVVLEVFDGEVP